MRFDEMAMSEASCRYIDLRRNAMGDSCVEVLIQAKRNKSYAGIKIAMYVLCAVCIVLAFGLSGILFFAGVAVGIVGAFVIPNPDYEFEYLLLNKELTVDKIIAKSKRKSLGSYDLNKAEIICPINSHELDAIKNKKPVICDYSSHQDDSNPYAIAYHDEKGDKLIYIEKDEEMFNAIKAVFPRKIVEH